MSYSVNITSTFVDMVGAVVSMVTLDVLELEALPTLDVEVEDMLDWLDDI